MSRELVREIESLLADAGYGPASGVTTHKHGDLVVVSWQTKPAGRAAASVCPARIDDVICLRVAVEVALTTLFRAAGYAAVASPDGFVLVSRQPVPWPAAHRDRAA
ncbi:hypothetical protein ACFY8C_31595 [Streptomyces flavochromogenes]|uniref:Uncharacterized protein n=1 Tax=Streptomyces flavochromogenes TaxID=68199 RepID=A0ABW6XZ77_9ACTN